MKNKEVYNNNWTLAANYKFFFLSFFLLEETGAWSWSSSSSIDDDEWCIFIWDGIKTKETKFIYILVQLALGDSL